MRKIIAFVLVALFAAAALMTQAAMAQEEKPQTKAAPTKREQRWHGTIVRFDEKMSCMDVARKGGLPKTIYYDSSTKWTQGGKVIERSTLKEGSANVICLGNIDEKGHFLATRVDVVEP